MSFSKRWGPGWLHIAVAVTILAACEAAEDGDSLDHYFAAEGYPEKECNRVDDKLRIRREARLFARGRVEVPPFGRSLQRYYRRHGLSFFSTVPIQKSTITYVLDDDARSMRAALETEYPGVDVSSDAALDALQMRDPALYQQVGRFILRFMFRPLVEFAQQHGAVGRDITNFVITGQILRSSEYSGVLGLAVSPELVRTLAMDPTADGPAWLEIGLPSDFTPMMFLDSGMLAPALNDFAWAVDLVAAHEFGHTAGLVHRKTDHNLMYPSIDIRVSKCSDSLDEDQLAIMRATLGVPGAPAARVVEGPAQPRLDLATWLPPARLHQLLTGDRRTVVELLHPFVTVLPTPARGGGR